MKAIYIEDHGGLERIKFGELDTPELLPGYVLVKTRAAALNHLDLFVISGMPGINVPMPHTLGSDGSGTVESVGDKVHHLSRGDRVMLNAVLWCRECEYCISGEESMCVDLRLTGEHAPGTYAEYFLVPEDSLERIPDGISFEEAAAFSLVFQTAWRMLVTQTGIQPGQDVFIHGIGGGVASAALQIAKLAGCRVFVSSSSEAKLEKAGELGADFRYNYEKTNIVEEVLRRTAKRGVDVVVDDVGAATWRQSLKLACKGGKVVTCGATTGPCPETDLRLIFWKQLHIIGSTMSNRREYQKLVSLLGQGRLKPVIDRVFPLSRAKDALGYLKSGDQFGKVVLRAES